MPPGLVLLVCAFLPAYLDSCANTLYPYELGPMLLPYTFGLSAVVWSAAGYLGAQRTWPQWQLVALGHLCYWAVGVVLFLVLGAALADSEPWSKWLGLLTLAWLLPLRPAIRAFARRRPASWRALRALWLGSYACTLWFSLWTILPWFLPSEEDKSHSLYGTWLALAASTALFGAGLYLTRLAKVPSSPRPATGLPETRVRSPRAASRSRS